MKKDKGLKITLSGGKKNRQVLTLGDNNNNHDHARIQLLEQRLRDAEKLLEALRDLLKEKDRVIRLLEEKKGRK